LFLHVLDDLWDFLTKFLFVAFNFWEPEKSLFHVFDVSGPSGYQMNRGKMHSHYFSGTKIVGERTRREEPRGPNGHGPRGWGLPVGTLGPVSTFPYNHAFVSPEKRSPYFS
jgi:hypothetical protein